MKKKKLNLDLEIRELGKTIFGGGKKLGKKSAKGKLKGATLFTAGEVSLGQCTNPGGGCPGCNRKFAPPSAHTVDFRAD